MRHLLANLVTYAIAAFLALGAATFAWLRSAQVVLVRESAVMEAWEPREGTSFAWEALGESGYVRNCANCHGREGRGWDQYPGLAETAALLARPGGREYLIDLHLYGLASPRWRVPMPPMGHLSDAELAAVVNHVLTRLGEPLPPGTELLHPAEVRARRGAGLRPAGVERRRPRLSRPRRSGPAAGGPPAPRAASSRRVDRGRRRSGAGR